MEEEIEYSLQAESESTDPLRAFSEDGEQEMMAAAAANAELVVLDRTIADAIIAAGMGMPPLTRFTQAGMAVYFDRSVLTAGEVLALFQDGQLVRMSPEDACQH